MARTKPVKLLIGVLGVSLLIIYMYLSFHNKAIGDKDSKSQSVLVDKPKTWDSSIMRPEHRKSELLKHNTVVQYTNSTKTDLTLGKARRDSLRNRLQKTRVRDMTYSEPGTLHKTRRCAWKERAATAASYCLSHRTPAVQTSANYSKLQMLVDPANEMMFCIVYKAASSTMKRYFASTRDGFDVNKLHSPHYLKTKGFTMMRDHTLEEQIKIITNYRRALVVRHPFDRLRTSYYNKFVHSKQIGMNAYRKAIDMYRVDKKDRSPTMHFDEFVKYILANNESHWMTVQDTCDPCRIIYDYVLKIETFYDDLVDFTANVMHRDHDEVFTEVYHPGNYAGTKFIQSDMKHLAEFKGVDDTDLKLLRLRYQHDMEMFGYAFDRSSMNATCAADDEGDGGDTCC